MRWAPAMPARAAASSESSPAVDVRFFFLCMPAHGLSISLSLTHFLSLRLLPIISIYIYLPESCLVARPTNQTIKQNKQIRLISCSITVRSSTDACCFPFPGPWLITNAIAVLVLLLLLLLITAY